MRLFVFLLAFACVQAASFPRPSAPITNIAGNEGNQPYTIRVDFAYSSPLSCRSFFKMSKPSQSSQPVTAYRWAFRSVMNANIAEQNVTGTVRRVSIRCNDPQPRYSGSQVRRIIMTALLSPISGDDLLKVVDGYQTLEARGAFTDLVLAKGGPNFAFDPLYFNYKNRFFPICTQEFGGCSPFPWNPNAIVFIAS